MNSITQSVRVLSCLILICLASTAFAGKYKYKNYTPPGNPLVFVHGGAGSASQFESQAMRFTGNGYPQDYLFAFEYDSSFTVETFPDVLQRLGVFIADVLVQTGSDNVDLMGHSLGTFVLQNYLSIPGASAPVEHYINIDGFPADSLPGGVPTLALWAEIGEGGFIVGGNNVTVEDQTHVETATSAESFYHMYTFLTEREPRTTKVRASRSPVVTLAGRAVLFPSNVGVAGADVDIYEVDGSTGQRIRQRASFTIDESGDWGPVRVKRGAYYEFVIARPDQDHHVYREPFLRDDHFVRLLTSPVGAGVGANVDTSPVQTNIIVSRDRELIGEREFDNDLVVVNGQNVINSGNSPISNRTTGIYLFDANNDGESDLDEPLPYFHGLPFLTGNDLFLPASEEASTRVTLIGRGEGGLIQQLNIPAWPSDFHRISIQFSDFVQGDSIGFSRSNYFKRR